MKRMDPAWVGVVGALLGVVTGAFAEWLRGNAVFRREKACGLYDEKRSRLEQVYELLEQVRDAYTTSFTTGMARTTPR